MNFLFFGTSLALLEAELCPFKDWEEISNFSNSRVVWIIHKSVKDAVKFDKRVKLRVP